MLRYKKRNSLPPFMGLPRASRGSAMLVFLVLKGHTGESPLMTSCVLRITQYHFQLTHKLVCTLNSQKSLQCQKQRADSPKKHQILTTR